MSEELLRSYDKELNQLVITCEHPSCHPMYQKLLPKIPIVCLKIPNIFFILVDQKRRLRKKLSNTETSGLSDLVNKITEEGRVKISSSASQVESRLARKCAR